MGLHPPSALIFCDDAPTRRAVRAIVESCGFQVVRQVWNAADALAGAQAAAPDVVIADVVSLGDLGLGMIGALARVAPQCGVIVLSSFEGMRSAALEAGAVDVVSSTDLRLLASCLRRLLSDRVGQDAGDGSPTAGATVDGSLRTKAPSS